MCWLSSASRCNHRRHSLQRICFCANNSGSKLKDKRAPSRHRFGSFHAGPTVETLRLALGPDRRQTGYVDSVASKGIPTFLEVEVSVERTTAPSESSRLEFPVRGLKSHDTQ